MVISAVAVCLAEVAGVPVGVAAATAATAVSAATVGTVAVDPHAADKRSPHQLNVSSTAPPSGGALFGSE